MNTNQATYTEHDLVLSLASFLVLNGYNYRLEVSNMGQSIDVVAYKNRWYSAIEVKKHDWRTAVKQCKAHRLIADYIIVAVAQKSLTKALSEVAELSGIGVLLYYDEQWHWALEPKYNRRKWKPQRKLFVDHVREVSLDIAT